MGDLAAASGVMNAVTGTLLKVVLLACLCGRLLQAGQLYTETGPILSQASPPSTLSPLLLLQHGLRSIAPAPCLSLLSAPVHDCLCCAGPVLTILSRVHICQTTSEIPEQFLSFNTFKKDPSFDCQGVSEMALLPQAQPWLVW